MKKTKLYIILCAFMSMSLFAEYKQNDWSEMAIYDNKVPDNIIVNEKFEGGHPNIVDYVFVRARVANLRKEPNLGDNIIKKYPYDTKLIALKKINNYGNLWYYVKDDKGNEGYVSGTLVKKRTFRFQKALDKINELEQFLETQEELGREIASTHSYVPNPNNQNFKRQKDKYGNSLDQSTIATEVKSKQEIYVPDRSILSIVEKGQTTSKVMLVGNDDELVINNSAITKSPVIRKDFNKVIAIDVPNQNMMVFEKHGKKWELISYVYSKTGIESALGFETPKGFFTAPMAKYIMPYNDERGSKQGYARYAIRFSGGGYLHGTPINYDEEINSEFFMKQKEKTLGTFTGTRKCVRTTQEHANFLFNWLVNKPNKKSNEQRLDGDIAFIIF